MAKLQTAISSGDVFSSISAQFLVSIPFITIWCLNGSVQQYVSSLRDKSYILFTFIPLYNTSLI